MLIVGVGADTYNKNSYFLILQVDWFFHQRQVWE